MKSNISFKYIISFLLGLAIAVPGIQFSGFIRSWTVETLIITVYIIFSLPSFLKYHAIKTYYDRSIILPLIFFCLLTLLNLFNVDSKYSTPVVNLTMAEEVLLFYCLLIKSIGDDESFNYTVLGFVVTMLIQPILFLLGIGVGFDGSEQELRLTVFNQNTNYVGVKVSIAIAFLLNDLLIKNIFNWGRLRYLFLILIVPSLAFVVAAASRTAFIAFIGVIVFTCLYIPIKKSSKIFITIVSSFFIVAYFGYFLNGDSILRERLVQTSESHDLSERDYLWSALIPYAYERPIFGYGETGYVAVSAKSVGLKYNGNQVIPRSPHNVLVELLMYSGLVGLLLMLVFWLSLFKKSIILRRHGDPCSIILFIPIFLTIISQQILMTGWAYVIYAYIYARSSLVQNNDNNI